MQSLNVNVPFLGASALSHRVPKIQLNDMKWQVDDTRVLE